MISEGSCDTEDWSNDDENSASYQINKLLFKIIYKTVIFSNISQYHFLFDQVNAALVSRRDFVQTPNLWIVVYLSPNLCSNLWHKMAHVLCIVSSLMSINTEFVQGFLQYYSQQMFI